MKKHFSNAFQTRRLPIFVLAVAVFMAIPLAAQNVFIPPGQIDAGSMGQRFPDNNVFGGLSPSQRMRMAHLLNIQRQKAMLSDAQKLLILAQQLNAELTSPSSTMSPQERMMKLAEIEKLARSVKDKMSFAAGRALEPSPVDSYSPWR